MSSVAPAGLDINRRLSHVRPNPSLFRLSSLSLLRLTLAASSELSSSRISTYSHLNMDSGTKLENPSIVIEDLSSTPTTYADNHDQSPSPAPPSSSTRHSKKPSDPPMLDPVILESDRRRSVEASADENPFQPTSPSPTLSTQSPFHFTSPTALRQNKPHDGTNSHARRSLNATTTADDATVDHRIIHPLYPAST